MRHLIDSKTRLRMFLYHVCLGIPYRVICNQLVVGKSTMSKIVGDIAATIVVVMDKRYIHMPESMETQWSTEH